MFRFFECHVYFEAYERCVFLEMGLEVCLLGGGVLGVSAGRGCVGRACGRVHIHVYAPERPFMHLTG
jgi:hypothetical protein